MKLTKDSDRMQSRTSRIERERKNYILKRYLSGLMITTVAAVASLRLFQPVMIKLLSLYNTAETLYYELYIEPHPDLKLDTLRVTLESPSEYYEQRLFIGNQNGVFNNLILGRSYTLKVKGDFGFGDQTVYETTYRLTTKPQASLSISQDIHTLYYYLNINDPYDMIPSDIVILKVYQFDTVFQTIEIPLDISGVTQSYGEITGVKADGYDYHFEVIYPDRGGHQTLYEMDFTTSNDPVIYGEAYMDLTTIYYNFYVYDFALKRLTDDIKIELFDGSSRVYVLETKLLSEFELSIQGLIENIDSTKVYEIKVSLYFENGFKVVYQNYVYQWEGTPQWN